MCWRTQEAAEARSTLPQCEASLISKGLSPSAETNGGGGGGWGEGSAARSSWVRQQSPPASCCDQSSLCILESAGDIHLSGGPSQSNLHAEDGGRGKPGSPIPDCCLDGEDHMITAQDGEPHKKH